jgi:tetratricopeptide (TPR) repeat protein
MKNLKTLSTILISLIIFSGCAGMHYGTGMSHLRQREYPEAIDSFKTVLEKKPEYPRAHTQLGIAYYKTKMYEQAISELQTARKLRSSDRRARLFLGMAYLEHGKIDDAIIEWSLYVEMFPYDDVTELLRKGSVTLKSGEVLPETVDLITSSIESIIAQEDRIRDWAYYYRVGNFGYRHHYLHHHGYYYPCD